jgi:hypothetical protein
MASRWKAVLRYRIEPSIVGQQQKPFRQVAVDFAGLFRLAGLCKLRMLSGFRAVLFTLRHNAPPVLGQRDRKPISSPSDLLLDGQPRRK